LLSFVFFTTAKDSGIYACGVPEMKKRRRQRRKRHPKLSSLIPHRAHRDAVAFVMDEVFVVARRVVQNNKLLH
jgi:hypothetical protein